MSTSIRDFRRTGSYTVDIVDYFNELYDNGSLTTVLHKTKIYVLFSFFLFDIINYFQISSLDENWFYKNWQSRVATLLLPSIHSTRLLSKGDHCIVRIKFDIYVFLFPWYMCCYRDKTNITSIALIQICQALSDSQIWWSTSNEGNNCILKV